MRISARRRRDVANATEVSTPPGSSFVAGGTRWLLAGALLLLLAAGLLIYLAVPSGETSTNATTFATLTVKGAHRTAVVLEATLHSVDTTDGSVQVGLVVAPGDHIPPDGAVVFSSLPSAPAIVVRPGQINPEVTATVPFSSGSLAAYPFDTYRAAVTLLVLGGSDTTILNGSRRPRLPYEIIAASEVAGFTATGSISPASGTTQQTRGAGVMVLVLARTFSTKSWVVAMMAAYWALALATAAVTIAIVSRRRPFDPRILAFLGALLFALITFRTAAPGNPPIGTFLDFYAMFESVGIVALSLLTLMVTYLARTRQGLDMV
jgi:hypothetical protein